MKVGELQTMLESYIPRDRARAMAQSISEDMETIGFVIKEAHFTSPDLWRRFGATPQAEYLLPPNEFDINSKFGSRALGGSFLTIGNLLRLGQCAALGRQYIPKLW